ncbi:hypothetical protein ACW0JT_08235 [Arthrobacter sp. SA17]
MTSSREYLTAVAVTVLGTAAGELLESDDAAPASSQAASAARPSSSGMRRRDTAITGLLQGQKLIYEGRFNLMSDSCTWDFSVQQR